MSSRRPISELTILEILDEAYARMESSAVGTVAAGEREARQVTEGVLALIGEARKLLISYRDR